MEAIQLYLGSSNAIFPSSITYINRKGLCLGGSAFMLSQNGIVNKMRHSYDTNKKVIENTLPSDIPYMCGEIFLDKGVQIAIPSQISIDDIKARCMKVGMFDVKTNEYIGSTTVVYNTINPKTPSSWVFSKEDELNMILVKISEAFKETSITYYLIFEFVIEVKTATSITDLCIGWCATSVVNLRSKASLRLELLNGWVYKSSNKISDQNIVKAKKPTSYLMIDVRPYANFSQQKKNYVNYMPSLCVFPAKAMYYASQYRQLVFSRFLNSNYDLSSFVSDPIYSANLQAFNNCDTVEILIPFIKSEIEYDSNKGRK